MGLSDRDYMRKPASSQQPSRPLDDRVEDMVGGLFSNRRRLFLVAGIGLAILVVIALVFAMLS
jgi:hypothetical protein